MQFGMVGLGRMGANMVRRLLADGHDCVVYDLHAATRLLLAALLLAAATTITAPGTAADPGPTDAAGAPAASCADPDDCRLREAAAAVGISFGLTWPGSPAEEAVFLAEADHHINHAFSWGTIQPTPDTWNFGPADASYQFALDHGLDQTGLHFAWDQVLLDDLPDWVLGVDDPDDLRAVLRDRAQVIFDRYPELDRIDVINEPFQTMGEQLYENHFHDVLGPDYISELFAIVGAEAPPNIELFVNEAGVEYLPGKADALVALAEQLLDEGARLDAVGLQTHLFIGEPNWDLLLDTMQRLDALGLDVMITELDVPVPDTVEDSQEAQADRYRRVVELCLMVPACDLVNIWGVSDAHTWIDWFLYPGLDPLLWDADLQPKPAYDAVRDALLGGRLDPPDGDGTQAVPLTSGEESLTFTLSCTPSAEPAILGLSLIGEPVSLFAQGSPTRMEIPAELRWAPTAAAGAEVDYEMEFELDLPGQAASFLDERARPAVVLAGYRQYASTAFLTLDLDDLTTGFDVPDGATATGTPTGASTGPSVSIGWNAGETALNATLDPPEADTREPGEPFRISAEWSVVADEATTDAMLVASAPTVTFDLTLRMGVVVGAHTPFGGIRGPWTCAPTGMVPELHTTITGTPPTTTTSSSTPTTQPTPVATPIAETPTFTG